MSVKSDLRDINFLVDFILPELTPYEFAIYLLLVRMSPDDGPIKIGKRTMALRLGTGVRAKVTNMQHVTDVLNSLMKKGFIRIGNATREGTAYQIIAPAEIPAVAKRMNWKDDAANTEVDHFTDPGKRREIFDRDGWVCQYCGEPLDAQNATLDHYVPQCEGGDSSPNNLKSCCLSCNSIKSGKSYEEAAAHILRRIALKRKSISAGE